MATIRIERYGAGWRLLGASVAVESDDLEWIAYDALLHSELHGLKIELGEGVPADAIERARARKAQLDDFRKSKR
jgi:hypothetical protein